MSADLLTRAAAAMRERAEAAQEGPWRRGDIDTFAEAGFHIDYTDVEPGVCGGIDPADAEHIASWHPAVALAVADWLDSEVNEWGELPHMLNPHSLAVARAYLGEQP